MQQMQRIFQRIFRQPGQVWSDMPLRRKGLVVVSIPVVALLITLASSLIAERQQEDAEQWVAHSLKVETGIEQVHVCLLENEIRQRDYLLTKRPEFLSSGQARRQLSADLSQLHNLVQDNSTQMRVLSRIQSLATQEDNHLAPIMAQVAALQRRGAQRTIEDEVLDKQAATESEAIVDNVRPLLDSMRSNEEQLLGERLKRLDRLAVFSNLISVGGTLLGLLGGVVAMLLFTLGIGGRVQRLEENAGALAAGVPLVSQPRSRDELGALAWRLEQTSQLLVQREQALGTSEKRYRALAHNFPNGAVFVFDCDLRHLIADGAGLAEIGLSQASLEGKTIWEAFPPTMHEVLEPLYRGALNGEAQTCELPLAGHIYLMHAVPLPHAAGEMHTGMMMTQDITEAKQAEAALHYAMKEADRANQAKSEFLSRMSHELRTPLNAILGFGQLLDKKDLDPLAQESVGYILKGGRHLLGLINEVLDIARVEAGHVDLSLEPIALEDVVPEACALVRPLATERNIRLDQNTLEPGHHILADHQRLKQVLLNLLSNAIKYNHEGGQVEVSCDSKPDGWTSIAVRDSGPGISPQDLTKLFTPFERLSASTSEIEGTGLGLVLSQRLVRAMGGKLSVTSTLGEGTTFTIELPQATSPAEQLAKEQWATLPEGMAPADTSQEPEHTYSVLCIEDNLSNLRLLEVILQGRPEITLLAAMQGSVGLDMARQHEPDLILLDLNLPDIHGQEVLSRLQQSALTRDIPVVVISADATPRQIERLMAAGASAYLTKPLDVDQFLHTLDRFLLVTPAQATPPPVPPPSIVTQLHHDEEAV